MKFMSFHYKVINIKVIEFKIMVFMMKFFIINIIKQAFSSSQSIVYSLQ